MIGQLMEFIYYFMLLSTGDYSLYFLSNMAYEKINKIDSIKNADILDFYDWVIGNAISYVFIYLIYTQKIGYLYVNLSEYTIIYTVISPFAYLFLQDFMFYILHRIAHIPFLYKWIHYVHHKQRPPTTWSGRISHHIDSNMENIAFTLPAMIMPINQYIWMVCLIFTFIWGNYLHDSTNRDSLYLLNDNSDHCLHHYYGENNYNFAYFFNHWDIIFRTYKKHI